MAMDWEKKETPAVTKLGQLVARLALNENLYKRYLKNPKRVIASAGLSKKERKALLSEDWSRILKFLGPGTKPIGDDRTGDGIVSSS